MNSNCEKTVRLEPDFGSVTVHCGMAPDRPTSCTRRYVASYELDSVSQEPGSPAGGWTLSVLRPCRSRLELGYSCQAARPANKMSRDDKVPTASLLHVYHDKCGTLENGQRGIEEHRMQHRGFLPTSSGVLSGLPGLCLQMPSWWLHLRTSGDQGLAALRYHAANATLGCGYPFVNVGGGLWTRTGQAANEKGVLSGDERVFCVLGPSASSEDGTGGRWVDQDRQEETEIEGLSCLSFSPFSRMGATSSCRSACESWRRLHEFVTFVTRGLLLMSLWQAEACQVLRRDWCPQIDLDGQPRCFTGN